MMTKIFRLGVVLMLLAVASGMPLNAQNNMKNTLTERRQYLSAVACLEAKGDMERLGKTLDEAFEAGLTLNELKEALSGLYAYTGFPRSLNALSVLQSVSEKRRSEGARMEEGRESDPLPSDYDALKQGTEVQSRLTGKPFKYAFSPSTDYYLKAHLFGDIFARNVLSPSDREVVTISALSGLKGVEPQLKSHVAGSRNMGVTDDELQSIPAVLAERVGSLEAWRVAHTVAEVLGIPFNEAAPLENQVFPTGNLNTAYARYFIGNSYLAPMSSENGGPVNVTFEPRCRNNWHIHHKGVQVLICVAGRGWYQEWGKDPVSMQPGTVIAIPEGVKHWHGAAHDSWFQHLTYMTKVEEGASNEWLEPVSDEEYNKLEQ